MSNPTSTNVRTSDGRIARFIDGKIFSGTVRNEYSHLGGDFLEIDYPAQHGFGPLVSVGNLKDDFTEVPEIVMACTLGLGKPCTH